MNLAEGDYDSYGLPDDVSVPLPSETSGAAKRRAKKLLPRCFLFKPTGSMHISGAMLLTHCVSVSGLLHWQVDRVVELSQPASIRKADIRWHSTLLHLQPDVELSIRHASSAQGGSLNDHFGECAGSQWPVWPLDATTLKDVRGSAGRPFHFSSHLKFAKAVGVIPSVARCWNLNGSTLRFVIRCFC